MEYEEYLDWELLSESMRDDSNYINNYKDIRGE